MSALPWLDMVGWPGGHAVGVREQLTHLVPGDVTVEPDADPASMADVRRAEVPVGGRDEGFLRARFGRAPQVRELVVVVPVRPEHRELLADEERWRTVAELLGGPRKPEAHPPDPFLDLVAHIRSVSKRPPRRYLQV